MHVLAVFAHPLRNSFMGQTLDSFAKGVQEAGHTVEIADLHRESFNPVMKEADFAAFEGKRMPDDVLREQARVERADAVALIYPIFWWSFPAILKGWFDRVFCQGWAFAAPDEAASLLPSKPWAVLCAAGLSERTYRKYGYLEAITRLLEVGTFGYCGVKDATVRIFYEVDLSGDASRKTAYLDEARRLGQTFAGG